METIEARKQWNDICKNQPRMPYLAKYFWKNEGDINIFSDKMKLKDFVSSRLTLQETQWEFFLLREKKI